MSSKSPYPQRFSTAEDRLLAGRSPHRSAGQSLIVRHAILVSERRLWIILLTCTVRNGICRHCCRGPTAIRYRDAETGHCLLPRSTFMYTQAATAMVRFCSGIYTASLFDRVWVEFFDRCCFEQNKLHVYFKRILRFTVTVFFLNTKNPSRKEFSQYYSALLLTNH